MGELVAAGLLAGECARIFQARARPRAHATPDGTPLTLHRHQREAIEAARTGDILRAHHRHRLRQVAGLHRADRRPRAARARAPEATAQRVRAIIVYPMNALANSQLERAREVPAARLRRGPRAGHLRPLHRPGERRARARDPRQPAGHPADQLRDAGADAHPARRARSLIRTAQGPAVPGPRRAAHLPGPAGRGRRAAGPPRAGGVPAPTTCSASAPRPRCPARAPSRSAARCRRRRDRASSARTVRPEHVIGETLVRATGEASGPVPARRALAPTGRAARLRRARVDPLARWIETTFGLARPRTGPAGPAPPDQIDEAAAELAEQSGVAERPCARRSAHAAAPGRRPRTRPPDGRCSRSGCTSSCPRATPSS